MTSIPADIYSAAPPHPCERLGRITGQSNFLSLLAGVEAGADTTQDMAALAMARRRGIPEMLEAYWGGSRLHRWAICQIVFDAIHAISRIKDRDRIWVKGSILDAFDLVTTGECPVGRTRAKQFRVDHDAYHSSRKLAESLFRQLIEDVQPGYVRARLRA